MGFESGRKRIRDYNEGADWGIDSGHSHVVDQIIISKFAQNHLKKIEEELNHLNKRCRSSILPPKHNTDQDISTYETFVQPQPQMLDTQQLNQWYQHFPEQLNDQSKYQWISKADAVEPVQSSTESRDLFMASGKQDFEAWDGSDVIKKLLNKNYMPDELPHLEQWSYNSEEASAHEHNGSGSTNIKQPSASLADSLTSSQIREHLSSLIKHKKETSDNTSKVGENTCQLCLMDKLLLTPATIYCSSCDMLIKRNVGYYRSNDEDTSTQHRVCMPCFKGCRGATISSRGGGLVSKASLHKTKNDDEKQDSWVECDRCKYWQHRICGLYNNETDSEGKAEYVCPKCCLIEMDNVKVITSPKTALGAKYLPKTNLSDHIEQRLHTRLRQERAETAKFHGIELEKVPEAEGLVVRVIASVDKELEVKKKFRDIIHGEYYPKKTVYRSKRTGGVDVCLFGMFVQEFGSDCNGPNKRSVYISYLDSVKYFEPERETASGESLRTFVYHEILIGYLEYCKKRGFATCYLWACPPKGEDYIFYCHPKTQKTPQNDELIQWYKSMLKKAAEYGIVVDQTSLYNHFFDPARYGNVKISVARLPYFDGDYWSEAALNISNKIDDDQRSGGLLNNLPSKAKLAAMGHDKLTRDALVMHKLGKDILPSKEKFMIIRLQHTCTYCDEVILSGTRWCCKQCNKIQSCSRCYRGQKHRCRYGKKTPLTKDILSDVPHITKDKDAVLVNNLFGTRNDFLNKCHRTQETSDRQQWHLGIYVVQS
ncbi:hypothetical protein QVD17_04769 [Tagetes erecta]|uniref:histone acetyltransferase n=1 Tax=Tagetes erecta TaxID=13708 RepID=A0AAD8LHB3_TARER|nr:hypothetical protein QVD17_04769 [Tagetes erecta]